MKSTLEKRSWILSALLLSCIWYTVASLALLLLYSAMDSTTSSITVTRFLLIYPFAFWMGCLQQLDRTKLHAAVFRIIHCVGFLAGLYFFLLYPVSSQFKAANQLLLMLGALVIYWIIFGLVELIRHSVSGKSKDSDKTEYKNVFKK